MLIPRGPWYIAYLLVIVPLEYHACWILAWLRDGEPLRTALASPLEHGSLFWVAVFLWIDAQSLIWVTIRSTGHAPARRSLSVLNVFAFFNSAPLIAFATTLVLNPHALPLHALGIAIEQLSLAATLLLSVLTRVYIPHEPRARPRKGSGHSNVPPSPQAAFKRIAGESASGPGIDEVSGYNTGQDVGNVNQATSSECGAPPKPTSGETSSALPKKC